jgi:hypothetical protein
MVYKPDSSKGLEVYVDADFAGGWDPGDPGNAENVYSRTGFIIRYASCPIFWQSKLQTEIALSTAEAEYIALSQALRETIPTMNLMKEINVIFPLYLPKPKFAIKVREDNQSCIAMANNPKFSPRTKHIAIKYHHFWKHVITQSNPDGFISIGYCSTDDQIADIFTKPVRDNIFFQVPPPPRRRHCAVIKLPPPPPQPPRCRSAKLLPPPPPPSCCRPRHLRAADKLSPPRSI